MPNDNPTFSISIASGLLSGTFCAGAFHTWDRAIYFSVTEKRTFLTAQNFANPFHGLSQTLCQKAISGSCYFILQAQLYTHLSPYLEKHLNPTIVKFTIGTTAGTANGILTHSFSAIKYHTWKNKNASFCTSLSEMYRMGGVKPFLKGMPCTILRGISFGSTYEVLRHLNPYNSNEANAAIQFLCNCAAATSATMTSALFNYVRLLQFHTCPDKKPPSLTEAIAALWQDSKTAASKVRFFQTRLCLGWGTARVAAHIAIGQSAFDATQNLLNKH